MEKISGILPSSSRITNVDLTKASPVRPGVPSFGRPEGVSNMTKNGESRTAWLASKAQASLMAERAKSQKEANMVQDIADKFFVKHNPSTKVQSETETIDKALDDSTAINIETVNSKKPEDTTTIEALNPSSEMLETAESVEEDWDRPNKGSLINVSV